MKLPLFTAAPLRVYARQKKPGKAPAPAQPPAPFAGFAPQAIVLPPTPPALPEEGDPYITRLVKLVPSEIVGLYLMVREEATAWLGRRALVCLVVLLIVRSFGTQRQGKPVQVGAVLIAAVSFVIWVYATGGYLGSWVLPPILGIRTAAVAVWTFIVPAVYRGDPA